jgi:DNA-binding protein H-NS
MPRRISLATIRTRIRVLEMQARRLERSATKGLRAAAAVIAKHGLSLSEVQQAFALGKVGTKHRRTADRPVPIKYKDAKGNTWTGRGRTPLWLVAAEKAGKKRHTFLLGATKAGPSAKPRKSATKKPSPKTLASKRGVAQASS